MRGSCFLMVALLLAGASGHLAQSPPAQPTNSCESVGEDSTPCFTVHGRLYVSTGLRARIWVVGTKRLLGVENLNALPKNISNLLTTENRIYGDFVVCPLTRDEPGHMRIVELCSGSNLVIQRYDSANAKWQTANARK